MLTVRPATRSFPCWCPLLKRRVVEGDPIPGWWEAQYGDKTICSVREQSPDDGAPFEAAVMAVQAAQGAFQ